MKQPEFIGEPFSGRLRLRIPRIPFGKSGKIAKIVWIALILLVIWGVVYFSCIVYIRPNEYGVKEIKIGLKRGIEDKVYGPGLWFVMPFGFQRMHRFPRNVMVLELTAFGDLNRADDTRHYDKAARIQTSDGFYVDVDVSILYRIADPLKLIRALGPGRLYLDNGILPKAEPVLKQALGELTTEEFYVSPKRTEKAEMARAMLDAELAAKGLRVEQVLVRYFKYSEQIQQNIEAKKLQDQLVFKNISEGKAAKEEANLKRVTQEGAMRVRVTLQEGEAYKVKKEAERDLYTRKKRAEGDLLVKLAEARRTELQNQAMQIVGADKMVALRMAEVLQGLETIIVPTGGPGGFNPLDLEQVLGLFGVEDTGSAALRPASGASPANAPPRPALRPEEKPTGLPSQGPGVGEIAPTGQEAAQ